MITPERTRGLHRAAFVIAVLFLVSHVGLAQEGSGASRARSSTRRAARFRRHGHGAERGDRVSPLGDLGCVGRLPHRRPSGGLLRRDGRGFGVRDGSLGGRGRSRLRVHQRGVRPEGPRHRAVLQEPQGQAGTPPPDPMKKGPRMQIYGFVMIDLIYDFKQVNPDWFDVLRPTKLPSFQNEFGENGNFWASVRQTRFGVRGWLPTGLGRGQDRVRVRPLRGRRGRRPDHDPPAPGLGRARLLPRRPDRTASSWTETSSRTSSSTGAPTEWSSSATSRCAGRRSTATTARLRPRAAGSERRQRQFCRPHRAAEHQGTLPVPGLHGALQVRGQVGPRPARRDLPLHRLDRHPAGPVRPLGHAIGWGVNLSPVIKVTKTGDLRLEATYGQGIENYMNDAPVDVGDPGQLSATRHPDHGQGAPGLRHGRVLRLQLERQASRPRSATRGSTSPTATASADAPSRAASTR